MEPENETATCGQRRGYKKEASASRDQQGKAAGPSVDSARKVPNQDRKSQLF